MRVFNKFFLVVLGIAPASAFAGNFTQVDVRPGAAVIETAEALRMLDAFPKFHVYDSEGRHLGTLTGYGHDGFENPFYSDLKDLMQSKSASSTSFFSAVPYWLPDVQEGEVGEQKTIELPSADFYVIERYAEWCTPCVRFTSEFPEWARQQDSSIVLIKLDLMPKDE